MTCASQAMLSANTCTLTSKRLFKKYTCGSKRNLKLFTIRASSDDSDCNTEECAPEKEVGMVSLEWLAGEKTKVVGTFPPRARGWMLRKILQGRQISILLSNNNGGGNDSSNIYGHDRHFTAGNPIEPMTVVVGLAEPIIDSYTKMVLGESRRLPKPNEGSCSICLSDYQPKDTIRCIPDCHHCFHADCIDGWLQMSATCPLCRNSPAPSKGPTPVTTPLAEVVPLAFHAR